MKKILIFVSILLCLSACKKKTEDWFVITENGSMRDSLCSIDDNGFYSTIKYYHNRKNIKLKKGELLPAIIAPIELASPQHNWYLGFHIVLDSTDKVYIYQSDLTIKHRNSNKKIADENIDRPQYSNFIGLRPEYLLAFDSKSFVDFLKNNNDIFGFDINDRDSVFVAVVASTKDTIQNPVLYQLKDLIKGKQNKNFLIRKTTEEENAVIYHKRHNIPYNPENVRWTSHFLDGKHHPFTPSYNSLEQKTKIIHKAVPCIKRQIKRVRHIS